MLFVDRETSGSSVPLSATRGVLRVHPAFRAVALAEAPGVGGSAPPWLGSEQLTMFLYHHMRALTVAEETDIIHRLVWGKGGGRWNAGGWGQGERGGAGACVYAFVP